MIRPTCSRCGWIHTAAGAEVVGSRFTPDGVNGYRSSLGGPLRASRAEADRDWCDTKRQQQPHQTPEGEVTEAVTRQTAVEAVRRLPRPPAPDPAPFPAALMETAARAKAWRDFLAQVRVSLMVWEIDGEVRDGCEHVLTWLRHCRDELAEVTPC